MSAKGRPDDSYEHLITLLTSGISHRALYFDEHPRVTAVAEEFVKGLRRRLQAEGRDLFFLGEVRGRLVHEGRYLVGPTLLGRRLVDAMRRLHSGGFLFRATVTADDLCRLFALLASMRDVPADLAASRELLRARGIVGVELSPPYEDPDWFGQFLFDGTELEADEPDASDRLQVVVPVYQSLLGSVEDAHGRAERDREIDVDGARGVSEKVVKATRGDYRDILRLARYPDYDSYTVGHCVRVALLAVLVGRTAGCSSDFLVELCTAALLHDVGKSKIPHDVLYKRGRLDPDERRLVAQHPVIGAQILMENADAGPVAVAAAWGHHVRHDGGGYPRTAAWAAQSRVTALVQVCDVFEALTAVRPYKPALTARRAYEIMLRDPDACDPVALGALVRSLGLYPPGCRVKLSNGASGVVEAAGTAVDRPRVELTHAPDGTPFRPADRLCLELSAPGSADLCVTAVLPDGGAWSADESADENAARVAIEEA